MNWVSVRAILLVLAIALLAVLAFRQVRRLSNRAESVPVAAGALVAGATVGPEDVALRQLARDEIPAGAVREPARLQGQRLQQSKMAGEPFTAQDFQRNASLAERVPEGRVLITLPFPQEGDWLGNINTRDRFDILAVLSSESGSLARVVASDAILLARTPPRSAAASSSGPLGLAAAASLPDDSNPPELLHLAVKPAEALRLFQAPGRLEIVLHGAQEVQRGDRLPVADSELKVVDVFRGETRVPVVVP